MFAVCLLVIASAVVVVGWSCVVVFCCWCQSLSLSLLLSLFLWWWVWSSLSNPLFWNQQMQGNRAQCTVGLTPSLASSSYHSFSQNNLPHLNALLDGRQDFLSSCNLKLLLAFIHCTIHYILLGCTSHNAATFIGRFHDNHLYDIFLPLFIPKIKSRPLGMTQFCQDTRALPWDLPDHFRQQQNG